MTRSAPRQGRVPARRWSVPAALMLGMGGVLTAGEQAPTLEAGTRLISAHRWKEAVAVLEPLTQKDPDLARAWFLLGYAYHQSGDLTRALPAHLMAAEFPETAPGAMYNIACAYAIKHDADRSFRWLRKAGERGYDVLGEIQTDPDLANLRSDPRFAAFRAALAAGDAPLLEGAEHDAASGDPAGLEGERQMDFRVGRWEVFRATGERRGTSIVQKMLNGQLIVDNWVSRDGERSKSFSFFSRARNKWVRGIIFARGDKVVEEGAFVNGALRFAGTHVSAAGDVQSVRSVITPLPDRRLRVLVEQSADSGQSWHPVREEVWMPGAGASPYPSP